MRVSDVRAILTPRRRAMCLLLRRDASGFLPYRHWCRARFRITQCSAQVLSALSPRAGCWRIAREAESDARRASARGRIARRSARAGGRSVARRGGLAMKVRGARAAVCAAAIADRISHYTLISTAADMQHLKPKRRLRHEDEFQGGVGMRADVVIVAAALAVCTTFDCQQLRLRHVLATCPLSAH